MKTHTEYWYAVASKILRAEMAKRKISYQELTSRLQEMGIPMTIGNLRARVAKGAYSAALLIQCLKAMEIKHLTMDECYFESMAP